MELIKETVNINEAVCKGTTQVMVEGDVIVPDTKPDILKLLQVDAVSCVNSKEISDGGCKAGGRVDMTILYIPDKAGEKIRSIGTSIDFSQKIDNEKIKNYMTLMTVTNVERVEFSMLNSRKLKVKAIVEIQYEVLNAKTVEIASEIEDCESAEVKKETIKVQNTADMSEHEFIVKECLEIPNGQTSICEILKTDVEVRDTDYKTVTGKIVAKGVLSVCILYNDENGDIEFMETELPFTEVFDTTGVGEETVCDIDYSVMQVQSEMAEDTDGDNRLVNLEIKIGAQVKACDNVEIEMICDCYEPYKKTELEVTELEIEETALSPSVQNTVREIVDFGSGVPGVEGVYNVITRPYVTKTQIQRNKLLCEGKIEACILYLSDSVENPVYSIKKEIPFSYMMDCEVECENPEPEIRAEVKHTSYNLNAAGEVEIRCILSLSANVLCRRRIKIIETVETDEPETDNRNGIVIYFVQRGDDVWNIAKHYCVPVDAIAKFNNIDPEEKVKAGQRLFIPAGK